MIPVPVRSGLYFVPPAAAGVSPAAPAWNKLNVVVPYQDGTNWCWAAVTAGIRNYQQKPGSPWDQCEVSIRRWTHNDCCTRPTPSACNQKTQLEVAFSKSNVNSTDGSGYLSFAEVRAEIDDDNPLGAAIRFGSGLVHFVEVDGYRDDDRYVFVNCPERGALTMTYQDLVNNFNNEGGMWDWWYRTTP